MSGSFNRRRVAEIIRASQADWRRGYDLGKKRQGCGNRTLDTFSPEFQEGYRRGYDESLGRKSPEVKPAPPRMSPEEESREQSARGIHLAQNDPFIPVEVLAKCHPSFRQAYNKALADAEQEYDGGGRDYWNHEHDDLPGLADIAEEYRREPEY